MDFKDSSQTIRELHCAFQYVAAVSASLATFSTGIVLGWPSQITDKLLTNGVSYPITSSDLGWVCSASSIGAAFLSLFIGPICDRLGRKTTMMFMILPLEIGWLLMIFSNRVWMLIVGRILTGMVGGSFCVTVSIYIDEIAHKKIRGVLGGLTQFMMSCGILFSNIAGEYLSVVQFSIACALVPIVFGTIFMYMPETPAYLLSKGEIANCKKALRLFYGSKDIEHEFKEVEKNLHAASQDFSYREVFGKRSTKKACVIGVGLAVLKVMSGIDAITSYLSHIFNKTKTEIGANNAAILFATVQVFSVIPQTLVVDKWGRKILLLISQFLMAICLIATGLGLALKGDNTRPVLEYIPVVSLCIYTIAFCIGIGPVGWILSAEIFDEKIKGPAMSFCTFLVWFLAFGNVKAFEVIEYSWDLTVPLFIYGIVSSFGVFFMLLVVPETKNQCFEEIEKALTR